MGKKRLSGKSAKGLTVYKSILKPEIFDAAVKAYAHKAGNLQCEIGAMAAAFQAIGRELVHGPTASPPVGGSS